MRNTCFGVKDKSFKSYVLFTLDRSDRITKVKTAGSGKYVKDDSKTVAAHVAAAGKSLGIADLKVLNFTRLELGEGVDKKTSDFATEVAEQIAAASK